MDIDERFLAYKPISEILGLSLELKDYEDRVQKRYDYIQEQLELDPEYVGYDYIEYYPKLGNVVYATKKNLISTNGDFYKLKGDVWIKARSKQSGPYKTKGIRVPKLLKVLDVINKGKLSTLLSNERDYRETNMLLQTEFCRSILTTFNKKRLVFSVRRDIEIPETRTVIKDTFDLMIFIEAVNQFVKIESVKPIFAGEE